MTRRCYSHLSLFAGRDFEYLPEASIYTEGDRILKIRRGTDPSGIDMEGALFLPAFVNGHSHLGDTGARDLGIGLTLEEAVAPPDGLKHRYLRNLSREELVGTMRKGLREMLRCGISACADFREGGFEGAEALREAAEGLPIKVLILGRPLSGEKKTPEACLKEIDRILSVADGLGIPSMDTFSTPFLKRIRKKYPGRILAVHGLEASENAIQRYWLSHSAEVKKILRDPLDFIVHLTQGTPRDIRKLSRRGIKIIGCPRTNAILGDGIPRIDLFEKEGLIWGMGSDNMMFSSPEMLKEADFASRSIRGHLKQPDCLKGYLLKNITWMSAKVLGLDKEYGSLEPGSSASFIGFSGGSHGLSGSHDLPNSILHRTGWSDIRYFISHGMDVISRGSWVLKEN